MITNSKLTIKKAENGFVIRIQFKTVGLGDGDFTFIANHEQAEKIVGMYLGNKSTSEIKEYLEHGKA